LNIAR